MAKRTRKTARKKLISCPKSAREKRLKELTRKRGMQRTRKE